MNKYEKLRTIVLIVGVLLVVFVIIVGGIIVMPKRLKNNLPSCNDIPLYTTKVGEEIPFRSLENNYKTCTDNNFYYQINGFAKDDLYLKIYVNVIKKNNNHFTSLNNIHLANEDKKIDDVIKEGTRYCYTFIKNNDQYILKSIELQ